MRLLLVQHGDAVDESVDPERPLSKKGIRDVVAIGMFLQTADISVGAFWHSGKKRALQTAERLAGHIGASAAVEEQEGLKPNDDAVPVLRRIEEEGVDVAVVGHLPHLDRLASLALCGREEPALVRFEKGSVLCLEREGDEPWSVAWMLVPSLL